MLLYDGYEKYVARFHNGKEQWNRPAVLMNRAKLFESTMGSQLFLLQISAIWLIPLRALKRFFPDPPSGSVTPSRTRTRCGIVIDLRSER